MRDGQHIETSIKQRWAVTDGLGGASHASCDQALREHMPASAPAYCAIYERMFDHPRMALRAVEMW